MISFKEILDLNRSLDTLKKSPFIESLDNIVIPQISQAKTHFLKQPEGNNGHYIRNRLLITVYKTIAMNKEVFRDLPKTVFCWTEKRKYPYEGKKIFCEHGWLPRFFYQVSSLGCNSRSHIKFNIDNDYVSILGGEEKFYRIVENLKGLYGHTVEDSMVDPFYLVALQTGNDLNLLHSNSEYKCYYGKERANELVGQAVIDTLESRITKVRLVFTQHPSDSYGELKVSNSRNLIFHNRDNVKSIDLLKQKSCLGVISINSNILHEALLFSKPIYALGSLLWDGPSNPFQFDRNKEEILFDRMVHEQYLAMLLCYQWTINDFENPMILREILLKTDSILPVQVRDRYLLI